MSKNTWMPLYIGDYLADTSRLTTEQHGAYMLLIMDYWRNGAPPNDDNALANITRLPLNQWKKHRPIIAKMFQIIDGEWKHKRIEKEIDEAIKVGEKYSKRAKAAADKRWNKEDLSTPQAMQEPHNKNATSNATSTPQAMPEQCPSPSPSPLQTTTDVVVEKNASATKNQNQKNVSAPELVAEPETIGVMQGLELDKSKCLAKAFKFLEWRKTKGYADPTAVHHEFRMWLCNDAHNLKPTPDKNQPEPEITEAERNLRIFNNLTRQSQIMELTEAEKTMLEEAKRKIENGDAA